MASDPTTAFLLQITPSNLQWAMVAFFIGFAIVRGAYALGVVDEHAIQENKLRKGTLAISAIVFTLGTVAAIALVFVIRYPLMYVAIGRMPHLMNIFIMVCLVAFIYFVDFLKNILVIYGVQESGKEKALHLVVDLVNLLYGLSFAFFAIPVLYYLGMKLTGGAI